MISRMSTSEKRSGLSARDLYETLTLSCGYRRASILERRKNELFAYDETDNVVELSPHPLTSLEGIKFENKTIRQIAKFARELGLEEVKKITLEEFNQEKTPSRDGLYLSQAEIDVKIKHLDSPLHLKGDLLISKGGMWHIFEIKAYFVGSNLIKEDQIREACFQASLYVLGLRQANFAVSDMVNIVLRDYGNKFFISQYHEITREIEEFAKKIPKLLRNREKALSISSCARSCPMFYRCADEEEEA